MVKSVVFCFEEHGQNSHKRVLAIYFSARHSAGSPDVGMCVLTCGCSGLQPGRTLAFAWWLTVVVTWSHNWKYCSDHDPAPTPPPPPPAPLRLIPPHPSSSLAPSVLTATTNPHRLTICGRRDQIAAPAPSLMWTYPAQRYCTFGGEKKETLNLFCIIRHIWL